MGKSSSLRSTLAVSLNNYLDAGAIVAGASGLTLWQNYLGLSEMHLGFLNFISANCLGAAIGAIIGGFLADKYGRKFIFTYNLLVYMLGVLLIMCSVNFPMLLAGFLVTGISVGVGVPASWTYISESSEIHNRGRNISISQMSWGVGPMCILFFGMLFAPDGYLFGWVESIAHFIGGSGLSESEVNVFSSRVVFFSLFVVAFIAWNLQRKLQESSEFEASIASGKQSSLPDNIKVLFKNKVAVKTVLFLAGIYLTWNLVASVMGFFQPHIYESAGGMSNKDANMLSCISWVIVVASTFILSFVIDKVAHRIFYVFGLLCALSAWFIIVGIGVNNLVWLWVFTILWGINNGVSVQVFYALWGTELFPAKFRAGAQGLMFFIVRGLSAVWGLVFAYIYGNNGEGFTVAAYCMIALLLISLIVGFIGAPNTRGKSLDEITKERYGMSILNGRKELESCVMQVAEVAGYLWEKGWAERNGGNITVNVTEYVDDEIRTMPAISNVLQIGTTLPYLKGQYFYCKGTGKRMRDLARCPMQNGSIIRILDDCASYVIIADEAVMPTSELPSHLSMHNYLIGSGSTYKASLHTHPIELVAMSHNKEMLKKDVMTKILWSMIPETLAFAPLGLGIVPYELPGSVKLAEATLEQIKDYDVVMWEKHGVCAVGKDIMDAFDQIDVLNKAANIYMCAKSMGFTPDGMTEEAMREVQVVFNLPKTRPC